MVSPLDTLTTLLVKSAAWTAEVKRPDYRPR